MLKAILLAAAGVVVYGAICWNGLRKQEPEREDRPVSYWPDDASDR